MKRKLLENLKEWKDKQGRKPLIIQGARQVGKTYLLKQFGETYYENNNRSKSASYKRLGGNECNAPYAYRHKRK